MNRTEFLRNLIVGVGSIFSFVSFSANGQTNKSRATKIAILDTHMAGFKHYDGQFFDPNFLKPGTKLALKPEPNNKFDSKAIAIYYYNNKLGYIPQSENTAIFNLLKHNKKLLTQITGYNPETYHWQGYYFTVYLVEGY